MFGRAWQKTTGNGCLFFLVTGLVSCFLLIANQSVVASIYHFATSAWPGLESRGSRQFSLFVGPVVLLFLEWWLIDTLFWSMRPEDDEEDEEAVA